MLRKTTANRYNYHIFHKKHINILNKNGNYTYDFCKVVNYSNKFYVILNTEKRCLRLENEIKNIEFNV